MVDRNYGTIKKNRILVYIGNPVKSQRIDGLAEDIGEHGVRPIRLRRVNISTVHYEHLLKPHTWHVMHPSSNLAISPQSGQTSPFRVFLKL